MTLDDDLREALNAAAPPVRNTAGVRAGLSGSMLRARRMRRVRVAAASTIAGLVALSGTAVALNQITREDPVEIGPSESLPAPETSARPEATSTTTTTTSPPPTTTEEVEVEPDTTTTTSAPVDEPSLSGPHETDCGEVTFVYSSTTVTLESRTVVPGYRLTTEGDGTSELHATWDEGPRDECQVEAHLENGVLKVQRDEEPS